MRKAAETWDVEKEWWKYGGGGAVWDGMAFDAEAGLVYVGTGNAQPWTFRPSFVEGQGQPVREPRSLRSTSIAVS